MLRKSRIRMSIFGTFGRGASAFVAEDEPMLTLVIPVVALLLVLLRCGSIKVAQG